MRGTAREVLRTPGFTTFWSAMSVSRLGELITLITLASASYALTESAFVTTAAVLVVTVPQAAMGVFGGVIADALGHRRAMVLGDSLRAVCVATIPLVLFVGLPLVVVYAVILLAGVCGAIFAPARGAIVPTILPVHAIPAGNSLVHGMDRAMEIVGALGGGLLFRTFGDRAFFASALAFAVSAFILSRLPLHDTPRRSLSLRSAFRDAIEGLAYIRSSAILRPVTVFSVFAFLLLFVFNGLLPVLIFRTFAPDDRVVGGGLFGLAQGVIAVGAVAASLLYPTLFGRIPKGRLMLGGFAAFGLTIVFVAFAPSLELLLGALFLFGFANLLLLVPNLSIVQEATAAEMRGRVFGARVALISLAALPAGLLGGALADQLPVAMLVGAAGVFTTLVAVFGARVSSLRNIP